MKGLMKMKCRNGFRIFGLASLALCLVSLLGRCEAQAAEPLRLKVMTFNVRCATAGDGPNRWTERSQLAGDVIRRAACDFIGMQEVVPGQLADLKRLLPDYQVVALSREADPTQGEASPIYYLGKRWTLDAKEHGTFWISETPDKPGSKSWNTACPRIVTWGRFIENPSGRAIYVFNTHFDHISQAAREHGAAMLVEQVAKRANSAPCIVVGDLNSNEQNPAVATLAGKAPGSSIALVDTFRAAHPDATEVGTFHAFSGVPAKEGKIDYIFATPGVKTLAAEIVREHYRPGSTEISTEIIRENHGERYPTDHFPVVAEVELP
jgi:endonuclease/exonuclease/phosphatase family metal-dependent hydrolase